MTARKRYPLQTLLKLREHRTEAARQVLLERQRETQARRDACTAIEREIVELRDSHALHRGQLLATESGDVPWPQVLAQRERHIELLVEQVRAAQARLAEAQQALKTAEEAQEQAKAEYFRARSRQEALEKRKDHWRMELRLEEARLEEIDSSDLAQARHSLMRF